MPSTTSKSIAARITTALGKFRIKGTFSRPPILIGGCGRSGTTLLLSILGAHPHIHAIKRETGAFLKWEEASTGEMIPYRMDRLYRALCLGRLSPKATRVCEKTPGNVRYIGNILRYFDDQVKFVHLVRDGRDVLVSRHPTKPEAYWVSPRRWVDDTRGGLAFRDHPSVLTLKYEDLVLHYERSIEKICSFIDEPLVAELLSYDTYTNVRKNRAWFGEAKKIHTSSIGKWKSPQNRERVVEIMRNPEVVGLLDQLGYTTEQASSSVET